MFQVQYASAKLGKPSHIMLYFVSHNPLWSWENGSELCVVRAQVMGYPARKTKVGRKKVSENTLFSYLTIMWCQKLNHHIRPSFFVWFDSDATHIGKQHHVTLLNERMDERMDVWMNTS